MSRMLRLLLLAAAGLAVFGACASACLNDRESDKSEREFKSHYGDPPPAPPAEAAPYAKPADSLLVYGASGVGAALLLGGLTIPFLPRRRG